MICKREFDLVARYLVARRLRLREDRLGPGYEVVSTPLLGSSVALKFCHPAAKMLATRIIHRNSKVFIVLLIKNLMFFDD